MWNVTMFAMQNTRYNYLSTDSAFYQDLKPNS